MTLMSLGYIKNPTNCILMLRGAIAQFRQAAVQFSYASLVTFFYFLDLYCSYNQSGRFFLSKMV